MEKNPDVPGKPARARAPMIITVAVNGIALRRPPMRSMSWVPAIAEITEPADMNRSALKKACDIRWKKPAA